MSRLAPLEAALFARLLTLQHEGAPTAERPFALVTRYAGPLTRDGLQTVCAQYPCLLVKRGRVKPRLPVETTLHDFELVAGDVWTLVLVIEEPRTIDDAVQGVVPELPGLLPLHDVVERTVNGLRLDGLWSQRPVHVSEYGELDLLTAQGLVYAAYVEVRADRSMEEAPSDDPAAHPLDEITGGVNLPPDAPQPSDPYTADTRP